MCNRSVLTFWEGRTIGTKSELPGALGIVRDGPQIGMRKFWGDDTVCILILVVIWLYVFVKSHRTYTKKRQILLYVKLYLNKLGFKKQKKKR